jgi:hypothetical protein
MRPRTSSRPCRSSTTANKRPDRHQTTKTRPRGRVFAVGGGVAGGMPPKTGAAADKSKSRRPLAASTHPHKYLMPENRNLPASYATHLRPRIRGYPEIRRASVVPEQCQQKDNGKGNAQKPKQYASSKTHQRLLTVCIRLLMPVLYRTRHESGQRPGADHEHEGDCASHQPPQNGQSLPLVQHCALP